MRCIVLSMSPLPFLPIKPTHFSLTVLEHLLKLLNEERHSDSNFIVSILLKSKSQLQEIEPSILQFSALTTKQPGFPLVKHTYNGYSYLPWWYTFPKLFIHHHNDRHDILNRSLEEITVKIT